MDFESEDAREIFDRLQDLAMIERNPPRDFVYTVERRDGSTVSGQVVDRSDEGLVLTEIAASDPIRWDDMVSVKIFVE